MLLLILALMLVVSAFLVRGVTRFYLEQFYQQMQKAFSDEEFVQELRLAAGREGGSAPMAEILNAYSGAMGIEESTRAYFILSGDTGRLLYASDGSERLELTPNIITALTGTEGYASSMTADYMDVAVPIEGDSGSFVICVRDNRQTATALTREMLTVILEALLIGLLISILLSFLLAKTMVQPIQRLTKAARSMAAGDFSAPIEVRARDEIGTLTSTFNEMGARLRDTLLDIESERNKLATVFLHMTDGIVAFSGEGEVIQFNPSAERLLGLEFQGKALSFGDIFGDIASPERIRGMQNDEVIEGEREVGERSLDIFLAPFYGEGVQGGILAVIHDVTVQRRSDEQRREFVANVSHELRTPITNVRSYAETLVEAGQEMPPETVSSFLGVILSESDRMTKLVQDLLALSKFDAGEVDFHMERCDLCQSVRSVYEAMRLDVGKHGLKLDLSLPSGPAWVWGDKARLEQVIINITTNAVRYTPSGGSVEMAVIPGEKDHRIVVQDTGIGIPKEDIPRIFDRFYRVDKARSRALGGTGLGLSIAFEIVRRHEGSIEIDSEVGKGTAMTVRLPTLREGERHASV
ncbi:MAG: HAMP domain-containing protein [Oscillospiraceae bacterium]|nr:HAMP domain-containing protein [Oscillospiraceae bacterium]